LRGVKKGGRKQEEKDRKEANHNKGRNGYGGEKKKER